MIPAKEITTSLPSGRWHGDYGVACCPAHDDHTPSLSIGEAEDGKILVRCHSGCEQQHVIDALRSLGLWPGKASKTPSRNKSRQSTANSRVRDDAKRIETALAIWNNARSAMGTLVETYLASRGLDLLMPPAIRFRDRLKHPSGADWPAMIALVTSGQDDKPVGILRTFLAPDGTGKAPVDPQKMMLGPCRGGAVRLAAAGEALMVGEGIETCLAAMQARGLPAWAALSTSGLCALELPSIVREVIVLADNDEPGKAAARGAALRWKREGRRVRIAFPPDGMDFNDMLLGHASKIEGATND